MVARLVRAVMATLRGIGAAVRARPGTALAVVGGVLALHVFLPPLVLNRREQGRLAGGRAATSRASGIVGACAGVLGLSTGPCSVVGCGAPVLPVVGLVFAGLSSGTLALLSGASRLLSAVVLVALPLVVAWRSEEHTSELQSLAYLVCRLLLEKNN